MSAALDDQYSKLSVRELIASLPTAMLAKMAAERFDVFSALVMPDAFSTAPAEFHRYLTDVVSHNQRTGRREAAVGPRGWGKSTTITEGGVLWIICRNRFLELQKQYRFILIVSDTTTQAEARLAVIKDNLTTNPAIERFFPEVFGQGAMWRQEKIVTRGDTCIATAGMNTSIRGARYKTRRPDLIVCHERGTMMKHEDSWIPVEQHPSFKQSFVKEGLQVKLHGIAHTETVTPEHMYWARTLIHARTGAIEPIFGEPAWVEARDLTKNHYIGNRISKEVRHPAEIEAAVYVPGAIRKRDAAGRVIKGGGGERVSRRIPELADPDIWFVVGLWWGDGSLCGKNAFQIVYNKRDVHVVEKTRAILARYGIATHVYPNEKSNTLLLKACWTHFATFLRTWIHGHSMKTPPPAVERLPKEHTVELIRGYVAADGWVDTSSSGQCVRITSIHAPGLYSVQRMLASLGITASVRMGAGPRTDTFPDGHVSVSKRKYDVRFRTGARDVFGYDIADKGRYRTGKQFIADGYVWRAVKSVEHVEEAEFCPITTEDHTYETVFGVSHNCDDADSIDTAKSATLSVDLQDRFDRDLVPAGHKETDIIVVGTVLSKMCLVYKILNTDHYATWNSRLFKAMEHFPTHMRFWDTWGSILKDKSLGKDRFAQAEAYYQTNKAVMDIGGVSNWPARYSVKELMYMFYAGGRKAFLTEQQNQIVDSGSTHFQVERYKLVGEPNFSKMLEDNNPLYYAYIDPSGGASASSKTALATRGPDKFSIAVIAKFGPRFFMLAESVGKQLRQSSQFEEVAKVLTRFNIYKLTVENNAGQVHYVTALNQFLAQKFADPEWVSTSSTPYLIQARGVNNSVPKNDRISMLEPHLDNGTLHLPAEIHSKHRDLADEFDEWPTSQFDDCLDAVSGCFFSAFRTFQLRYLSD